MRGHSYTIEIAVSAKTNLYWQIDASIIVRVFSKLESDRKPRPSIHIEIYRAEMRDKITGLLVSDIRWMPLMVEPDRLSVNGSHGTEIIRGARSKLHCNLWKKPNSVNPAVMDSAVVNGSIKRSPGALPLCIGKRVLNLNPRPRAKPQLNTALAV